MEVCCCWWTYLPSARRHRWGFRSASGCRTSSIVGWIRWRSTYGKLDTRRRYRIYVAVAIVAAASIRLFHVDGLRTGNSTRYSVLQRNISLLLHHSSHWAVSYLSWRLETGNFSWRRHRLWLRDRECTGTSWTRVGWLFAVSENKQIIMHPMLKFETYFLS